MMNIAPVSSLDFDTQKRVVELYAGTHPIDAVLHQALTGVAGMTMYVVKRDADVIGAAILKSSEAVMPIGPDVKPIAYAVSDVITKPEYRRSGIARMLVQHVVRSAHDAGGRIAYLYADANNHPAIRLYNSMNWRRLADQSNQAIFVCLLGEEYGAY